MRVTATAPPAATASTAIIVSSLVVLGRLSIAPTQGIVVVGHGTGVTGRLAVPLRRCAASIVEPPRLCAGSGTPPLRLCAVLVLLLVGGVLRSPEHDVSDWAAVDGDVAVCNVDPDWVGSEPRPVVPSPVVPRPFVPRAVTPRLPYSASCLPLPSSGFRDSTMRMKPMRKNLHSMWSWLRNSGYS